MIAASYCKVYDFTKGSNGFWGWLFIVSKLFELADTVFLVLRKKPLMFLHWYHHILTLIYAFYSYPHTPGFNRWGIFMNFFVHAFMYRYVTCFHNKVVFLCKVFIVIYFNHVTIIIFHYIFSYYFLCSMKMRMPRGVAMFITSLQILQFILSVLILAHLGILIYVRKVCWFWFAAIFQVQMTFLVQIYILYFLHTLPNLK